MSGPFLVALACTVVALVAVVVTGVQARRSPHYVAVVVMLVLLGWAIREAELMGAQLAYEGAAAVFRTVHFGAVTITFLVFPLLVVSGVRLARREDALRRKRHRTLAWAFVGCVLVTTALGTTMTLTATPIEVDAAPTEDVEG